MGVVKSQGFQLISTFVLGLSMGIWQILPSDSKPSELSLLSPKVTHQKDEFLYKQTAEIEPLLNLKAPGKNASVDGWYQFAVSFDELDLGSRYGNDDSATPLLAWYTLIAKYKPQALYKLYNQGKLTEYKFQHLLKYGYLKYWDESVQDVDEVLLKNNVAVLTMAYNKGVDETRDRVKQAFFKLSQDTLANNEKHTLDIDVLLFAMKVMDANEKASVRKILLGNAFKIDPKFLYRLKFDKTLGDKPYIATLIEHYSKEKDFTNLDRVYSNNKVLSSYMTDSILLGSDRYLQTMIDDIEFNEKQPTSFYCAACGLALSTEGLIAYPLINASKHSEMDVKKDGDGSFILSRGGAK